MKCFGCGSTDVIQPDSSWNVQRIKPKPHDKKVSSCAWSCLSRKRDEAVVPQDIEAKDISLTVESRSISSSEVIGSNYLFSEENLKVPANAKVGVGEAKGSIVAAGALLNRLSAGGSIVLKKVNKDKIFDYRKFDRSGKACLDEMYEEFRIENIQFDEVNEEIKRALERGGRGFLAYPLIRTKASFKAVESKDIGNVKALGNVFLKDSDARVVKALGDISMEGGNGFILEAAGSIEVFGARVKRVISKEGHVTIGSKKEFGSPVEGLAVKFGDRLGSEVSSLSFARGAGVFDSIVSGDISNKPCSEEVEFSLRNSIANGDVDLASEKSVTVCLTEEASILGKVTVSSKSLSKIAIGSGCYIKGDITFLGAPGIVRMNRGSTFEGKVVNGTKVQL